jgi:5-methyltetrahydropteroyltriglutamate--homocysteine methyltransferase
MAAATDRILTTHAGSLPRPPEFLPLVLARDHGDTGEAALFEEAAQAAVAYTVRRQADAGVDVLNDGEMSKPSYHLCQGPADRVRR